jgi:hypothetical protein
MLELTTGNQEQETQNQTLFSLTFVLNKPLLHEYQPKHIDA